MDITEALFQLGEFWKGVLFILGGLALVVGAIAIIVVTCAGCEFVYRDVWKGDNHDWREFSDPVRKKATAWRMTAIIASAVIVLSLYPILFMIYPWNDPFGQWVS